METFSLNHTRLQFQDLFTAEGLKQLDEEFLAHLKNQDIALYQHLQAYREKTLALSTTQISEFLIALAKPIEYFIAQLFNIEKETLAQQKTTLEKNALALFRKNFILSKVKRLLHQPDLLPSFSLLHTQLLKKLNAYNIASDDLENDVLLLYEALLEKHEPLDFLSQWCAQAILSAEGQQMTRNWQSLRLPEKLDYANLIPTTTTQQHNTSQQYLAEHSWRERDGFALTDTRMNAQDIQHEIHYCIYCHDHEGDLCSKGFPKDKKNHAEGFKQNALGVTLTGCPLEERISEMHLLKREGFAIASLAMIMVDNPMCPATGHRICNDCMKACIYQKQTPVNIPQIETRVLTDVLALPFGVEIYDLLTKWNPLRSEQWLMQAYCGKKIIIAGMGPAGFTMAHHLLQEGCAVVGFDGLKIEPLPKHYFNAPIRDYNALIESLDDRIVYGFGGVAEYGITVRWDKNFLKLIYLSLMRRPYFQVFGSMRFGGTLTIEDAWQLGFDHFVIAVGAGLPKALPVKQSMATGMRQANDFLMALQLTGAAQKESTSSLEIRLPLLVIGGGLTGVDAATEAQAYYIRQVEKISKRYHDLKTVLSDRDILNHFNLASLEILQEFLAHAECIKKERDCARLENRPPRFIPLIHQWGGVSIVYRQSMQASPAYIHNHEELHKALEEGIFYIENLTPVEVIVDAYGHCKDMLFKTPENQLVSLPAKSILVATGASLNVAYAFEHQHVLEKKNMQYLSYEEKDGELYAAHSVEHCKDHRFGPFTSYHHHNKHRVSFIGDTHPVFHGNVVKAIASAKYTYPKIMKHLEDALQDKKLSYSSSDYALFRASIDHQFQTRVIAIRHLREDVLEIEIHAPQASKHYRPGQFYRLQAFASSLGKSQETPYFFASQIDHSKNSITFTLTKKEAEYLGLDKLQANDKLALMGPTGVRSKISELHETICIIGNAKSLAHVRSYAMALKAQGNRVVFLGYFHDVSEIFYQKEIEALCDLSFWTTNLIQTLKEYAIEKHSPIPLAEVDRIQVIGNSAHLKEILHIQKEFLQDKLPKSPKITASVHSHMQCMLKGVCAQCLQWQIDPETGTRTKAVFACSWQDQPIEIIDLDHLASRERQNSCQETLKSIEIANGIHRSASLI